ncbi:hypothetical protein B1B04_08045 [Lysinibacillus sp. KCTC 33748]|uniref:hypothetical protein n=1 Tax=unclassified Lysinibacillus TaxID=2636778 RepID=UPI0009A7BCC0|nr:MULTISPECIES: hypothetical protein [unclassified Lysinibacillus]OXS74836.1 hypothetical protein B1B04_08045 [Lysinibacillus sp. KCTC 33748]SKB58231.1 hypothetical protein SAMN06295926_10486 [Lysinibacillus sp. AC-3]
MNKVVDFLRLNEVGDISKKKDSLLIVVLFSLFLVACNETGTEDTSTSEKPDAAEALRLNNQADIFQWEGNIFQTEIEWIDELEMNEDQYIGDIQFSATKAEDFKNGTANHLPIGAKQKNVMIF